MKIALVISIALCCVAGSASAQTRTETTTFIFNNTESINLFSFDYLDVKTLAEDNCVVKLTLASSPSYTFQNVEADITIDFNKLVMSSATIRDGIEIFVDGTDKGVLVRHNYSNNIDKFVTEPDNNLIIKLNGARAVNAFKYFITNFCTGKKSAF